MKKTALLLLLGGALAGAEVRAAGSLYVFAEQGLVLRSAPSDDAPHLFVVPFGKVVTVLTVAPRASTAEQYSGHWTRVRINKSEGWLFGAFLSPYPLPNKCGSLLAFITRHLGPPVRVEKREPRPPALTTIRHFKDGSFISLSGGYDFAGEIIHLKRVPVWPAFLLAKQCELRENEKRFTFEYGPDRIIGRSEFHGTVEVTGGPSGSTIKFSSST